MKKVRLGDICLINMGQSPESSSYNKAGDGLPFFQGNADFGELHPDVRVWCNAPTKIAQKDDILISVRAPIGALNIANTKCCIGRGLAALTVKQELCLAKYLWYAILSNIDYLNSKGTGSTFKAINKSILEETEIKLPDKTEQKKIASVLDKVSDLITLRKQQLTKLDELVKARFVEMFGDPIENPMSWPLVTISSFAGVKIGPFGSMLHAEDYVENGHPLINPSHIINNEIRPDLKLTLSDTKYKELSAYQLIKGDVIIGRRGEIGRCAVVEDEGLFCGTGSMFVRITEKCRPDFLQKIISFPTYRTLLEDKSVGVTMKNLNAGMIADALIPLPPLALQNEFASFVEKIDKSKVDIKKSLEELNLLKKSLMQEYFG